MSKCSALAPTRRERDQLCRVRSKKLGEHPRWFSRVPMLLFRGAQLRSNLPPQPVVARQAQHVIHRVVLAPSHQLFATETGIRPQRDPSPRPARTNLPHDPLDLGQAPGAGLLVRRLQPCAQQMVATKDVQRQRAVMAVVAVKKAAFLLSVQRCIAASRSSTICCGGWRYASRKISTSSSSIASEE